MTPPDSPLTPPGLRTITPSGFTAVERESLAADLGDSLQFLIPNQLRTIEELLAVEHGRILDARRWALSHTRGDKLSIAFLIKLHRRMYEGLWRWAGHFRRSDHPDGARWPTIGIELNDLVGEARFWRERKLYSPDDLALRFHHRLTRIRAWEGGNGTHARLFSDAIAVSLERPPFTWGLQLGSLDDARSAYASALREADGGGLSSLLRFARGT